MIAITGPDRSRKRQALPSLLLCPVFLLLSACAAVEPLDTNPLQDYQSAISSLKSSSDQALQTVYQEELDQFKARIASGDFANVSQLMLEFPPEPNFGWAYPGTGDKPLFVSIGDMRQTLAEMNAQLLDYAGLLMVLAGADGSTSFDASGEAQEFNANAGDLLRRLDMVGVETGDVGARGLALFSTVAANLADNYLENKRVELLAEILEAGLGPLQAFVDKAQEAMALTAASAKTQYQNQAPALAAAVVSANSSAALNDLLALNEQITEQLALYRSIYNGYGALPNSQRQIISAMRQSRSASLSELVNYAEAIRQQHGALQADSGAEPAGD